MNVIEMLGQRFGMLLVIDFDTTKSTTTGRYHWICQCDCGKLTSVDGTSLRRGNTRSCGCLNGLVRTLAPGETAKRNLYDKYKRAASDRGYRFTLSLAQFEEITQKDCFYCHIPPKQIRKPKAVKTAYVYNGIDRLDNNLDYTIENCVPSCGPCNKAKGIMSAQEYIDLCKRVAIAHS